MNANSPDSLFSDDIESDLRRGMVLELAQLYALNAFTVAEEHAVDDALAHSSSSVQLQFRQSMLSTREALTTAFGGAELAPPVGLWDKIVSSLPDQDVHDELRERRTQRGKPRRAPFRRRTYIWTAAAAAAVIGGVFVGGAVINSADPQQQILNASDAQTSTLALPGSGSATLAISRSHDGAVVTMRAVANPPAGKVYQLWLIPSNGDSPISQGTMSSDQLSNPVTVKGVDAAKAFAITIEPDGGSKSPTLPPIATLPLGI